MQSQYLLQALQALGAQPGGGANLPAPTTPGVGQDSPGPRKLLQSQYGAAQQPQHSIWQNIQQAGQNIMGVPGRLGAVPGNVAQNLSGLFGLGRAANPNAITSQPLPPARPY